MNPIHPANAIPPVARRIVLSDAVFDQNLDEVNQRHRDFHQYHPEVIHRFSMQPTETRRICSEGPITVIDNNRVLQMNNRLSTAPSIINKSNEYATSEETVAQSMKSRGPFSIIELITCFCPCINLC